MQFFIWLIKGLKSKKHGKWGWILKLIGSTWHFVNKWAWYTPLWIVIKYYNCWTDSYFCFIRYCNSDQRIIKLIVFNIHLIKIISPLLLITYLIDISSYCLSNVDDIIMKTSSNWNVDHQLNFQNSM
jgi:hypothetical protein